MELLDVISARQSVRAYQNKPVKPAQLNAVLQAATQAPSAGSLQAYQIYVVRSEAARQVLAAAAQGQAFLAEAPLVLVFCADLSRGRPSGGVLDLNYSPQDAIIAMAYAQLAAVDVGLASCWVGAFDAAQLSRALQLPESQRPMGIMPLGYAAESSAPAPRRPMSELVVDMPG